MSMNLIRSMNCKPKLNVCEAKCELLYREKIL